MEQGIKNGTKILNGTLFEEDPFSEHFPDFFHLLCYFNTFQHERESPGSVCAGFCGSIHLSACVYVS